VLYIIFVNKCTLFADRIRSSVRVVSGGRKRGTTATFLVSEVGYLQDWLLIQSGKGSLGQVRYDHRQDYRSCWWHSQRSSAAVGIQRSAAVQYTSHHRQPVLVVYRRFVTGFYRSSARGR
jgi:hypothetical protein